MVAVSVCSYGREGSGRLSQHGGACAPIGDNYGGPVGESGRGDAEQQPRHARVDPLRGTSSRATQSTSRRVGPTISTSEPTRACQSAFDRSPPRPSREHRDAARQCVWIWEGDDPLDTVFNRTSRPVPSAACCRNRLPTPVPLATRSRLLWPGEERIDLGESGDSSGRLKSRMTSVYI